MFSTFLLKLYPVLQAEVKARVENLTKEKRKSYPVIGVPYHIISYMKFSVGRKGHPMPEDDQEDTTVKCGENLALGHFP